MLRIYCARENVDKERFLAGLCEEDALLLVPDQYTLAAEKDLLSYLGRRGLLGMEVLSFSRLGAKIVKEAGGGRRPMIDRYGRHMLLSRIVKKNRDKLPLYGSYAEKTDFLVMLNNMISQMKQYGASPETLAAATAQVPEERGHLRRKLTELTLIFTAYEEAIRDKYVDTEDLVDLYCERMPACGSLAGRQIVLQGFDYFTPGNLRMIRGLLAVCREVVVMLGADEREESSLFALGEMMKNRLIEIAEEAGSDYTAENVPQDPAFAARRKPALSFLESQLFAINPGTSEDCGGITLVKAANYYSEAATAAKEIRRLVREEGFRYSDIVLICNDLPVRGRIAKRVFAGYGMDLFLDQKRDILASPAVSYILALLAIVIKGWRRRDVLALLKTGLADMTSADISRFENYCERYRIDGRGKFRKPFEKGAAEFGKEPFAELESLRAGLIGPLADFAEDFKAAATAREKADVLFAFLQEKADLPARMEALVKEQLEAGDADLAQETAQIWNMTMEILEQTAAVMGGDKIGMEAFAEMVRAGLEAIEVGVLPPTVDGLVMGTMQRTRIGRVKALFVLGANEGVLPADVRSRDVLTEDEKNYLEDHSVTICKMDRLRVMEEQLAIYRDLSRADEYLWISCAASNEQGEDIEPSAIYETIRGIFPSLTEQRDIESGDSFIDLVGGEQSTLEHLGRYFKRIMNEASRPAPADAKSGSGGNMPAPEIDPAAAEALLWYRENKPADAARLERAVSYRNIADPVGPETALALYMRASGEGGALSDCADSIFSVSPSRLEKFGGCPFAHFVKYGLHPEEPKDYAVRSFDMGSVYHEALKELARRLTKEGVPITAEASPWMTTGEEARNAMMDEILTERFRDFREGLLESDSPERYRADRLRLLCKTAGKVMVEQVRQGAIEGMEYEMPFGRGEKLRPIEVATVDGTKIIVEGQIDRVDYLPGQKVKVVDYKSEKKKYSEPEAKAGLQLQLYLYLAAAAGSSDKEPVGAFYFPVDAPLMSGDIAASTIAKAGSIEKVLEDKIRSELRMNGFMMERGDVIDSIEGGLEEGGRGKVVPISYVKANSGKGTPAHYEGSKNLQLLSQEDFESLLDEMSAKVRQMANDIAQGYMEIAPRRTDHERSSCTYCDYKGICKFDQAFPECRYVHVHP